MSASLCKTMVISALLATLGAFALIGLRALQLEERHWAYFFFAALIGGGVGSVADRRNGRVRIAAIAAAGAWVCGLAGNVSIALLERRADWAESSVADLSHPDFFIAFEAYTMTDARTPGGERRPFSRRREGYDAKTWRAAVASWNGKPEAEKAAIREDWTRRYEEMDALMTARVVSSIFGPASLVQYAIGAMLAAGVVAAYGWES